MVYNFRCHEIRLDVLDTQDVAISPRFQIWLWQKKWARAGDQTVNENSKGIIFFPCWYHTHYQFRSLCGSFSQCFIMKMSLLYRKRKTGWKNFCVGGVIIKSVAYRYTSLLQYTTIIKAQKKCNKKCPYGIIIIISAVSAQAVVHYLNYIDVILMMMMISMWCVLSGHFP